MAKIVKLNEGEYSPLAKKMGAKFLPPKDYGIKYGKHDDLVGGEPSVNKEIALNILSNKDKGPKRDVVVLNSACAIHVYTGKEISECVKIADELITSGKALQMVEKLREVTNDIR